jgi:glucose/arabinose dehydrogenase
MCPRPSRLLLLASTLVVLAGCSPAAPDAGADDAGAPTPVPTAPVVAAPSPSSQRTAPSAPPLTASEAAEPDLAAATPALEPLVELDAPTALAVRTGDDALYVAERAGRIVRVVDGEVAGDPVLDITSRTTADGERGLLGLSFSPDGEELYVSSTDRNGDSTLDAYAMGDATADAGSRRTLLQVPQPYANHNGGDLATGPDGLLYYALGDGGAGGDPQGNGQDRSTLLGGLLRIDPRPAGERPYGIPDDNPFVGQADARGELWVYGLRNPWRFSFDTATDDLWIGDVGQDTVEEIDRVPYAEAGGTNLGWNVFEGTTRFADGSAPQAVPPVAEYRHDDGRCSVTGGYVYRGGTLPDLVGAYLYGDYCDGVVRAIVVDDTGAVAQRRAFDLQVPALVSFGQDADGELYALSLEGTVFRLVSG